ncbi:MAG: hypothetical protein K6G69_02195 [Lachnospiraceae bacterium]|nr:hypothetical protein [Lachnospiraceae bacterium]
MKRAYKGIIAIILLVAVDLIMIFSSVAFNAVFFANFIFASIAVVLSMGVIIFLADKEKKLFKLSLTAYAIAYLVVTLYLAMKFTFAPPVTIGWICAIYIALLAVFLIIIICGKAENDFIKEQEEIRGREISNFKYTLECMKRVQSKIEYSASYKKTVEHAYDSLASGQTASSPDVEELEKSILDAIEELDAVVDSKDEQKIAEACAKIEKLAGERKARLAGNQLF